MKLTKISRRRSAKRKKRENKFRRPKLHLRASLPGHARV